MTRPLHGGGLAAWAIRHPIGVVMIALAVAVVGLFAFSRLAVDLLPQIIYPTIRVRILDPGVSAKIMEDQVTRQLEEQLAITEDAVAVGSRTSEGNSTVELSFQYGKDMDTALRDASTRLDRAKRFLPDTIDPPVIYKLDPAQIPVAELVVTSRTRDPVALRDWIDYVFSRWFITLPGVAAAEVGGGMEREIHVVPDPWRLAALGLSTTELADALRAANVETAGGRLYADTREFLSRTAGRFTSLAEIRRLPLRLSDGARVHLGDVARVMDTNADERIRVRLNGDPGVKVTIQKQPAANTAAVVDAVKLRLAWLRAQRLIPEDVRVHTVHDQSVYIRNALRNAAGAAGSGALLAMLVVYAFLGNLRRTLIVGTAIPLSVLVTLALMDGAGLTVNIMTLGGLAVGVGLVVDSTIVMLENIYRHQREGEAPGVAGRNAAAEVNGAIVASTSTNLAAIAPFLFVGGLVGLLFRELIFTISAAILASMLVALTLVPALATRVAAAGAGRVRRTVDALVGRLQAGYGAALAALLGRGWAQLLLVAAILGAAVLSLPTFLSSEQTFLPSMDDGRIRVDMVADPGIALDEMDRDVQRLEAMFRAQPEVDSVFSLVGGRIFGRTQRETSNRSTLTVQLKPLGERRASSAEWVRRMRKAIAEAQLAGVRVRMRTGRVRGLRVGRGEEDISLRITGPELAVLDDLGHEVVRRLRGAPGLRNIEHSSEESLHELAVSVDRERAAAVELTMEQVGEAVRVALDGVVVTDYIDGDRAYDVRLRLPRERLDTVQRLEGLLIAPGGGAGRPIHLADVASVQLVRSPVEILRDNQSRIVEVSASIDPDAVTGELWRDIERRLADLPVPEGYSLYEAGITEALQEGRQLTAVLLGLALFLVFVVMAVQYESLRDPLVILLSVPFAAIGVAGGLGLTGLPLSMPVWLGTIMLAGIVVNNAIVLVEYIEILRQRGQALTEAIVGAARLRLRPILMTTLTTAVGLLPLALGLGEGAEMLQPLAVTIVFGVLFSMLVSLALVPVLYLRMPHSRGSPQGAGDGVTARP